MWTYYPKKKYQMENVYYLDTEIEMFLFPRHCWVHFGPASWDPAPTVPDPEAVVGSKYCQEPYVFSEKMTAFFVTWDQTVNCLLCL